MTLTNRGITLIHMRNSDYTKHHPHYYYTIRGVVRFSVRAIALLTLFIAFTHLISRAIDTKYDYKCPNIVVVVEQGDTLSTITKRYCEGHTLQASWDIAQQRGTDTVSVGDHIQLGSK